MAQAGTDVLLTLEVSQTFVAPVDLTIVALPNAGVQTAGSTASTLTLNHNGTSTSFTWSVAASALTTSTFATQGVLPISVVAGDNLTATAAYGTSAALGFITVWLQRAV